MNKVAHYNGFVGRCQQYGLTKAAADMLYKKAKKEEKSGFLNELKESGKDLASWYKRLTPEEKAALIGTATGGVTGLAGGLLTGKDLGTSALLGLSGAGAGAITGYAGRSVYDRIRDQIAVDKLLKNPKIAKLIEDQKATNIAQAKKHNLSPREVKRNAKETISQTRDLMNTVFRRGQLTTERLV